MPGCKSGNQIVSGRTARRRTIGPEAREEPDDGLPHIGLAAAELRVTYNGAATGVIFVVDVVPLSILAS